MMAWRSTHYKWSDGRVEAVELQAKDDELCLTKALYNKELAVWQVVDGSEFSVPLRFAQELSRHIQDVAGDTQEADHD